MRGVAVELIVIPDFLTGEVDTIDDHAVTRQTLVPFVVFLPVLEEEELVVLGAVETVAHILRQLVEGVGAHAVDRFGLGPAHEPPFEEGVANGCVVTTTRHHIPDAWVATLTAALLVVSIVEVGQTQHVAELVDDGADAVESDG